MGAKIEVVSGNDLNSVTDVNGQSQFHPVQSSLLPCNCMSGHKHVMPKS